MDLSAFISDQPPGSPPPVPVSEDILQAQEQRLGPELKLPDQLRRFLLEVGSGDFSFGSVFSPVADGGDSSEMDRELEDFREAQVVERLRSVRAYNIELLPFARNRLGTLYLFNLLDTKEPNLLWACEGQTEGDDAQPTPQDETFWAFLGEPEDETAPARLRLPIQEQMQSGLEPTLHVLRQAIREHRVVELCYRDEPSRLVHPGCLFFSASGTELLRAYQVDGFSHQSDPTGWRSFTLTLLRRLKMMGHFEFSEEQLTRLVEWKRRHPHLKPELAPSVEG